MPLPTRKLDERSFQDIVDHAKRLIPTYCPEWTDHNVSDPGVALIELFASMVDMLLYRVNRVPERMLETFMQLIGVTPGLPRPARADVTFFLTAPAIGQDVPIAAGTRVETLRTDTREPVVFSTEEPFTVRPAGRPLGLLTAGYVRQPGEPDAPPALQLVTRQRLLQAINTSHEPIFTLERGQSEQRPAPGTALYLALDADLSSHVIALSIRCQTAAGTGVDFWNPPLVWEALHEGEWVTCDALDGTGGFNQDGDVLVYLPRMRRQQVPEWGDGPKENLAAFWVRCRVESRGRGSYDRSPLVRQIIVESRGATVPTVQAVTVRGEHLGRSDGSDEQTFSLRHRPILLRGTPDQWEPHILDVVGRDGTVQRYREVRDAAEMKSDGRTFMLDYVSGTVSFGPTLPLPRGDRAYRMGTVLPKGSELRLQEYRYCDGAAGNVGPSAIAVLRPDPPNQAIARITNRAAAQGGADAEQIEDMVLRVPQQLGMRDRAVTADDYEFHACRVPGVARAHCLAPGAQPADANAPPPGRVDVLLVPARASRQATPPPAATAAQPAGAAMLNGARALPANGAAAQGEALRSGPIPPEELSLPDTVRDAVRRRLQELSVVGVHVSVEAAELIAVSVTVTARAAPGVDREQLERRVTDALYHYLDPYEGGQYGTGWPFGRRLSAWDVAGRLQTISGVVAIEELGLVGESGGVRTGGEAIELSQRAVIVSGQHQVTVETDQRVRQEAGHGA